MANNEALVVAKDRGWLNGFGNLWRKENHSLWDSWSWLVRMLIWMAVVDGLLAMVAFSVPAMEADRSGPASPSNPAEASPAETGPAEESPELTALKMYFLFAAMFPAFGVIIFGQEDLIDERKLGTAAWVLSKPVSRAAFLLSKLSANALGVLGTMVLVQGVVAYFIYKAATGISLSIPGFLAGLGLVTLFLSFYLALALMLSTLFHTRGPVVAIPLALISTSYFATLVPGLAKVWPSSLILNMKPGEPSLAAALAQGRPLPTITPIFSTALLAVIFIIVAFVRFEGEEF